MAKFKYKKTYIILLSVTDILFFLYGFIMLQGKIQVIVIGTAIFLLYYVIIVASSSYTLTQDMIIYRTIFQRIEFKWKDIRIIESLDPSFIEKSSIAIYSYECKKAIPVTSWVYDYKMLLSIIIENIKRNEGVMIDSVIVSFLKKQN